MNKTIAAICITLLAAVAAAPRLRADDEKKVQIQATDQMVWYCFGIVRGDGRLAMGVLQQMKGQGWTFSQMVAWKGEDS